MRILDRRTRHPQRPRTQRRWPSKKHQRLSMLKYRNPYPQPRIRVEQQTPGLDGGVLQLPPMTKQANRVQRSQKFTARRKTTVQPQPLSLPSLQTVSHLPLLGQPGHSFIVILALRPMGKRPPRRSKETWPLWATNLYQVLNARLSWTLATQRNQKNNRWKGVPKTHNQRVTRGFTPRSRA